MVSTTPDRIAERLAVGAGGPVVGDGQLDMAEGKLVAAADVHRVSLAAQRAEVVDDLIIRNDQGPALLGDCDRIPDVIPVTVGHDDRIQL